MLRDTARDVYTRAVANRRPWITWSTIALIAVLAATSLVFTTAESTYDIYLFDSFLLAALGAVALNTLMGTAGQVSVSAAGFLAIGAFGSVWLESQGVGFPWSILLAALFAAVFGTVVALPAVRLHGLALGLGTIAAFYIVYFVADRYQKGTPTAAVGGFILPSVFDGGSQRALGRHWTWLLFGVVAVLILVTDRLTRGKYGRSLRVIRDHEVIAPALGIPVIRYKLTVFAWSSFVLGVQGGLTAYFLSYASVDTFTLVLSIQYIAMVLVGGRDSLWGSVLGAAVFSWLPFGVHQLASNWFGQQQAAINGAQYAQIAFGVVVLVFILASPDGLVGLFTKAVDRVRRRVRARGGGPVAVPGPSTPLTTEPTPERLGAHGN